MDGQPGTGTTGSLAFALPDDEPVMTIRPGLEPRVDPGVTPPLVTIDDLPDDVESVELADYHDEHSRPLLHRYDEPVSTESVARTAEPNLSEQRTQSVRATSSEAGGSASSVAPSSASTADTVRLRGPREPVASEPIDQRITAIRIAALAMPFSGNKLLGALKSEGLEFGRYDIFHRAREDGRLLFSVASLLEPGSFDLQQMPDTSYPGVSLFAVFPGPEHAPLVFDDMLAMARRLADRLGATLQDERGQPLGIHRMLAIREELAHFQDMVDNIRARSSG